MPISSLLIFILIFFAKIKESTGIQNVKLILPTIVRAGTSATLLCLYDLEGASLYSVQWYRGQFEFFRFVPNENPPAKTFQIPGLFVDTFSSNEHQVTLRNISVKISGKFSCEVTTDAPRFSTSCVSENLTVVDFMLSFNVHNKQYQFGDIIEANCTLTPKLALTKLIFHWNSRLIPDVVIKNQYSDSVLLHLNTSLFDSGQTFPILVQLRCSAILDEMYHIESKSVSLRLKPANPVSYSRAVKTRLCFSCFLLFTFTMVFTQKK